jgi:hypothetical protein
VVVVKVVAVAANGRPVGGPLTRALGLAGRLGDELSSPVKHDSPGAEIAPILDDRAHQDLNRLSKSIRRLCFGPGPNRAAGRALETKDGEDCLAGAGARRRRRRFSVLLDNKRARMESSFPFSTNKDQNCRRDGLYVGGCVCVGAGEAARSTTARRPLPLDTGDSQWEVCPWYAPSGPLAMEHWQTLKHRPIAMDTGEHR